MATEYTPNKVKSSDTIRVLVDKVNGTMDSIKTISDEVNNQEIYLNNLTWGNLKGTTTQQE